MADKKITELTNITGANLVDADEFVVVDISADETKAITLGELKEAFDSGSGFVRTTGDTMTGDLALSGADITFGDNDKAIFGAGSDLAVFSNGTDSFIQEYTTGGHLYVDATNVRIRNRNDNTLRLQTSDSGAVDLYYSGSAKLATTATGIDVTGNATFADNGKAIFGAGSDLQIYHDGTHSYIQDVGTGNLRIKAENFQVLGNADNEAQIETYQNDGVYLYFNGAAKLATTATGIDVTGTVTADGLTVDGVASINGANLSLDNAYYLAFRNAANTSDITTLTFDANDQVVIDPNQYGTVIGTSANPSLKVAGNRDISFYEDTGTTPKFFWDASAESLGIGTSSPTSKLTVNDANGIAIRVGDIASAPVSQTAVYVGASTSALSGGNGDLVLISRTSDSRSILFYTGSGTAAERMRIESGGALLVTSNDIKSSISGTYYLSGANGTAGNPSYVTYSFVDDANTGMYRSGADTLNFATGGSERMRIDSSGNVGIGVTPVVKLDVASSSGVIGRIQSTSGDAQFNISVPNVNDGILAFGDASSYRASIKANTSDALTFQTGSSLTERMRINSSGNVGIGDSSPNAPLVVNVATNANLAVQNTSGALQLQGINDAKNAFTSIDIAGNPITFSPNGSEAMRIDSSGNLLVGATAAFTSGGNNSGGSGAVMIARDNERCLFLKRAGGNGAVVEFIRGGIVSPVGSISVTTSATSYNTSSDYRLKTDAQPMTGASARVQALNPVNFEWLSDGTRVDGFLAHEAQEVVPEAVTGTKDAMRDEEYEVTPAVLDDDGNEITPAVMGTRSVPDYQGIDQSKLVPLLTAALQEALTKIDALETRITALEG